MELLEKITSYDLLGYALPGGVLLYVIMGDNGKEDLSVFGIIIFWMLSYVLGIAISECSSILTRWTKENKKVKEKKWEAAGLSTNAVSNALKNAKIIGTGETVDNVEKVWKYYVNMYSDIQVDKTYGRIHNYASAALLYKNMMVSIILCLVTYLSREKLTFQMACVLLIVVVCFGIRWYRFEEKIAIYTMNWYVAKYKNP